MRALRDDEIMSTMQKPTTAQMHMDESQVDPPSHAEVQLRKLADFERTQTIGRIISMMEKSNDR